MPWVSNMSEELLPTFFDHGDGELIPMEFTNSLFEQHTDVYDDIRTELEQKRKEHKKLSTIRTMIRKKIHAYETSASDLRDYLGWCQHEPCMNDLCHDIARVLTTIPTSRMEEFRSDLHSMVMKHTRDLRGRIQMLQEVLDGMRHQVTASDEESIPIGTCPICYDATVAHCMAPCGHCCCTACLDNNQTDRCFMCRQYFSHTIKLYL